MHQNGNEMTMTINCAVQRSRWEWEVGELLLGRRHGSGRTPQIRYTEMRTGARRESTCVADAGNVGAGRVGPVPPDCTVPGGRERCTRAQTSGRVALLDGAVRALAWSVFPPCSMANDGRWRHG